MKLSLPFPLLVCGVALGSCASLNCAIVAPGGESAIELAYVAGSDAPTMTVLRVFSGVARTPGHALLEIEPLGLRRSCRSVQGTEVLHAKATLKGAELARLLKYEAERGNDVVFHDPLLGIETPDLRFHRRPTTFTPSVLKALAPIEALFVEAFPRLTTRFLPFRIATLSERAVLLGVPGDPWENLGPPKKKEPPSPELVVLAKLQRIANPPGCGCSTFGAMAEYVEIKVLQGTWPKDRLLVAHACPELPRKELSPNAGTLRSFTLGDVHRLALRRDNFYGIEILHGLENDSETPPDFFSIRVDPADSAVEVAPPNQALHRPAEAAGELRLRRPHNSGGHHVDSF